MKTVIRPYFKSSSFKVALLFAVMLGISTAILAYFLYGFDHQNFLPETEAVIDAEITALKAINDHNPDEIIRYIKTHGDGGNGIVRFGYHDKKGGHLTGGLKALSADIQTLKEDVLRLYISNNKQILAAKAHTFADGSRIIVAKNIDGSTQKYDRLKNFSILIILLMAIVIVVSFAISHFVVSRINRIAVTARNIINTGDLSQRVSIATQWDDLSNLAQVLNSFLDQIEKLMTGVREVSNSIAHDLRTPLSTLRNDIETLKGKIVTNADLDDLLIEADRILNLFQSLLRINSIEKGKHYRQFPDIDLAQTLADVIDLYEPVAEEKNISLIQNIKGNPVTRGNPDLLFQLFANLLDNAIKFSDHGSQVSVIAISEDDGAKIIIRDNGSGIDDADKKYVFNHFYRGDASRTSQGYGLGLSLVKAIVDRHKGQIKLKDANPGLEVWIKL